MLVLQLRHYVWFALVLGQLVAALVAVRAPGVTSIGVMAAFAVALVVGTVREARLDLAYTARFVAFIVGAVAVFAVGYALRREAPYGFVAAGPALALTALAVYLGWFRPVSC